MKVKAAKAQKIYDGDIHFDHFGNMMDSPWNHRMNITAEQISGDRVIENVYDYTLRTQVKKTSFYTLTELNYQEFDVPVPYYGNITHIGSLDNCVTVKNFIFDDELKYNGFYRGQSSAGLNFISIVTGKEYTVFLTDLEVFINDMVFGVVKGKFTFCKRGTKYGVRLLK